MIIAVASGKGGTGKTFVATNLANVIQEGSSYIDCDVEAPNGHLFLNPEIGENFSESVFVPKIDPDKCTLCRKCIEICQFNALIQLKDEVLVFPELCHSCHGCDRVCPENAISQDKREIGVLSEGKSKAIQFAMGKLRIGEAMAPPLIERLKLRALRPDPQNIYLIDAPPGTACPAVTALKNTDFVLLVTEPTPFGFHDLKLAILMIQEMNLPFGIVINRSDVGNQEVFEYCNKNGFPILAEFNHDHQVAELYAQGKLITDASSDYVKAFKDLADAIINQISGEKGEAA